MMLGLLATLLLPFSSADLSDTAAAAATEPLRVVFLASADDDHPPGTHEYLAASRLLAHALTHDERLGPVEAIIAENGWPTDETVFERAHTAVVITAGGDRRREDHPLLIGDRFEVLSRAMDRGMGLVVVHWSTFVPRAPQGDRFLEWVGGHFDYESGEAPHHWASAIRVSDGPVEVVSRGHPLTRGVAPFAMLEEWYYRLRLARDAPGFVPLLTTRFDDCEEPQVVAFARERTGGGRGFATSGGHFLANYQQPSFRTLLLNAVVWTANREVPEGGVRGEDIEPLHAWIFTGEDHPAHPWAQTTAAVRDALLEDPRFSSVEIVRDVQRWQELEAGGPDVLVFQYCNWRSAAPNPGLRAAFLSWLERGGGLVLVHFASGAFHPSLPEAPADKTWSEWNSKICRRAWDHATGKSGHDAYGPFEVRPTAIDHPVTRGLAAWNTTDELYYGQVGDLPIEALIEARSKDTQRAEALAFAYDVGRGRVFQTLLGHDEASLRNPGTAALIRRAAVWCAGRAPLDLPTTAAANIGDESRVLPEDFVSPESWTPPYREGDPESEREEDWVDARFERMDTGPMLSFSVHTPRGIVPKAVAVRLGERREASALFDTNLLRMRAWWSGRCLELSPVRFGLLRMPSLAGPLSFSTSGHATTPLPETEGRWRGMHLHGERTILDYDLHERRVLDAPWVITEHGLLVFERVLEIGPGTRSIRFLLDDESSENTTIRTLPVDVGWCAEKDGRVRSIVASPSVAGLEWASLEGERTLEVPPADELLTVRVLCFAGAASQLDHFLELARVRSAEAAPPLSTWLQGGPSRWRTLETRGTLGERNGTAFTVDTLTLPFDNPWGALLFTSGVDFLAGDRAAVCTIHGDVWIVDGVDTDLDTLRWHRFATGLYQPLGLAVVGGVVHVLGRDQITRLHDHDGDGEADEYQCFSNRLEVRGDDHAYAMGLERDSQGRFYLQKSGSTATAHGGCLLRISADGEDIEVLGQGFRHANGLGVGPNDVVTDADNQGEWIPATRLNQWTGPGYNGGYQPSFRGPGDPNDYDPPLCWIPHAVDNSAGGQVWVEGDRFGLPAGTMLHTSYGRCRAMLVLPEIVQDQPQGGVVPLPYLFQSGVMRGRFRPDDGQLYLTGCEGWQTAASADGCLQRLRFVGGPLRLPIALRSHPHGVTLQFTEALDPASITPDHFRAERWNYLYSSRYGSDDWSVLNPDVQGHDPVQVREATIDPDGRTIHLTLDPFGAVMQQHLSWELRDCSGAEVRGELFYTVNQVPFEETSARGE